MIYKLDRYLNKFLSKIFEFDYEPISSDGVTLGEAIADIIIVSALLLGAATFLSMVLSIIYLVYYNVVLGCDLDLISIIGIMSGAFFTVNVYRGHKDTIIVRRTE